MTEDMKEILKNMQDRLEKASNDNVELFFITRTRKVERGNENKGNEGEPVRKTNGGQPTNGGNEDQSTNRENKHTRKIIEYQIEYEVLNTQLHENVREKFIEIAKKKINELLEPGAPQLEKYDPVTVWDENTVEFIDSSEVEQLEKIQEDMQLANNPYTLEGQTVPWAYAVRISDAKLIIFRKFSPSRILERAGWIPLFIEDGVFTKLEKPALTIDEEIDCIYDIENKILYIINKKEFEAIFSFMEMFIQAIDDEKSNLQGKNLVDNVDLLVQKCRTDPQKVRKLYSVLVSPTLNQLDAKKIERIDKQYSLGLQIKAGKITIISKDIWKILRVLADDYLVSPATILRYVVYSKTVLPRINIRYQKSQRGIVTISGNVKNADRVVWDWGDGNIQDRTSPPLIPQGGYSYKSGTYTVAITAYRGGRSMKKTFTVVIP